MATKLTAASFKRRAEAGFRKANRGAAVTITWDFGPKKVTWADGTTGYSGTFVAEADGYQTRTMVATSLDGRVSVR